MSYKRLFTVATLCLLTHWVSAQLTQEFRFEQEIKRNEEGFTVISLKKEGLAMVRDTDKHAQGNKKWQVEILDTTLTQTWSTEVELKNKFILIGYEYNPNHLYLLFREESGIRNELQLITFLLSEKTVETDRIKFEVEMRMTHFIMSGTSAVFGGYVNSEPAVLLYDRANDTPKILPGLFIKDMALLDVRANQNESFNVLLAEEKTREKKALIVRTFDHNGNLLMDDNIEIDSRFQILSGLTSALERDELIIVGTYGEHQGREALGFFSVVVDPFNEQPISYTDFSSLEHFLDYLPKKRAEKIKQRASKQKTLGQQPNYTTHVVPFRIEERTDGFYLLAEIYVPSHSNYNNSPYANSAYSQSPYGYGGYSPYGMNPYTSRYYNSPYMNNTPSSHSPVQMIETVVIKLGANGKAIKGASMKLEGIRQQDLEQVGDFTIKKDSIFIVYKKDEDIFYQGELGEQDDEKVKLNQSKIKLQGKNDALKNEDDSEGTTRFWYDNHFYVWGYQIIKDATRDENKTRKVFYVNRISVE